MRRVLALSVAAALGAAAPAGAAETATVAMPSRVFAPAQLQVVAGDSVAWANRSSEAHDVTSRDGVFDSGGVSPDASYSFRFDRPGAYPYLCKLHPTTMTGQVDVVPVALTAPAPISAGEDAVLTGRAPAGTPSVDVAERTAGGLKPVGTAAAGPDGTFSLRVRPAATTSYVASVGGGAGPDAVVTVVDRIRLVLRAHLGRRLTTLRLRTDPARPGDTVALQLYSPERFAWRQIAHGTLDTAGRVQFGIGRKVRRRVRVALVRDGRTVAVSNAVPTYRPRKGRKVRQPPVHVDVEPMPSGHGH